MEDLDNKIKAFLSVGNGDGDGYGYGYGDGNGYGNGDGYGYGYGNGYGNGYGYGYGNGYGYGYGNGYGNGDGDGDGDGNGYGNGDGDGDGNGYGNGIEEFEGHKVYNIDRLSTIITSIHGTIAKGFTIENNCYLLPCYIARVGNYFAHGKTAKEAVADATAKYEQNKPSEERIDDFISQFPTLETEVANADLYVWHNKLTGSCAFGRNEFAKAHGIDVNNGSMTVKEFISLTKSSYGGHIIKQLLERYGRD